MAQTYTMPEHIKGDTFDGVQFTVLLNGVAVNLTGATIRMDIRKDKKQSLTKRFSTETGEITITDAVNGVFQINSQIVDVSAYNYVYDIEITLANGEVKTYIAGTWNIVQDTTYG